MKRKNSSFHARLSSGESGQALIIVLVFLVLGALTLVPTLTHISTALKTGEIYEENTKEIYTADAGIEDGIWQIKYDGLEALFESPNYNYIFDQAASYVLDDPLNNYTANVTISNVWIPSNITLGDLGLTAVQAKEIIERPITDNETNRLIVSGTPLDEQNYRIKIDFYPAEDMTDNLSVSSIGIWLPRGFTYEGNCNLETFDDTEDRYSETSGPYPGGEAIVWDFSADPILFTDLPPVDLEPTDFPQEAEITFQYANISSDPAARPNAIAWIVTDGPLADYSYAPGGGVPIAWDIDTRIYKIVSETGETTIEAYTSRSELRNMYAATPGDYVAIGNSLMTDETNPKDGRYRDHLWPSSDATLSGLPEDAYISHAYLYWSGFFSSGFSASFWGPDGADNWNNWTRNTQQVRMPTADLYTSGSWSCYPSSPSTYSDKVSEASYNDGTDYITGVSSSAYNLFNFVNFSVPAGSTIRDITIVIRAKDASSGGNRIRGGLKVYNNYHNSSAYFDPTTSWATYSFTWTSNPSTGSAWSVNDINGSGSRPLQGFGVYSDDLDPDIDVSWVRAEVTYNSCWTISSGQFRGYGNSATEDQRYLTLRDSYNLTGRPAGSTIVEWMQDSSSNLEGEDNPANCDRLQFQVYNSADGWSGYLTAFTGALSEQQYYYYVIPEDYLTADFKIRFYLDGFNGSSEYAYIDDFAFATITGTPDTAVTFTIDGYDFHSETVNALVSQLIGNKYKGQYSFACWQDVTDLVRAHSERNADDDPIGNGDYTVGDLDSTPAGTSYELAYAGWSLVVIYHSESTAGRQLYLWNLFSYSPGHTNLDFDRDGSPGGTITGFIVPERIGNEAEAAKLTAFVGEGDGLYDGDQMIVNGTALDDGFDIDDVWNSQSVGMSKSGVDIDTFHIMWDDGIIHADDTQAQIDLVTLVDNYNLIYLILSVRSETTIGATSHYTIHGG